ncbi:MAG: SDR family oxidoreductase [Betaproteobacteria bacterium]|nr:SDR family oxidoreductase [Betaproteobacteria bacterium]
MKILVTGAGGFVGSALCPALEKLGRSVRRAMRSFPTTAPREAVFTACELSGETQWAPALEGVDCVVHLAARTHVLRETKSDALAEYRRVNVEGTRRLAVQAATAGVRRLVFLSSVKVNGERTTARSYTEDDAPHPEDAYGTTKWEAEQVLHGIAQKSGLEVIVLRPPLVYGPGVKGNFLRLMNLVARGVPLPLASIRNRRSLVYVGNLVDAIVRAVEAPQAAGQTYLVSDGEDVSTPDLVRAIAQALAVRPRLLPCPVALLHAGAALLGRGGEAARLTGSLQVDSTKIRRELGWEPAHTFEEGVRATAEWYRNQVAAAVG